jgi:hypothetical protein
MTTLGRFIMGPLHSSHTILVASANIGVATPIPPSPLAFETALLFYFFAGGAWLGFGGMFNGIVRVLPVVGSVIVTEGCFGSPLGAAGVTATGAFGTCPGTGTETPGFGAAAVPGCLSKIVLPTPARRVARIDSDSDVTMNRIADAVVAFDNSVADPLGPNAVCEPIPPKAPARSAAFPLCRRTTTIRNRQIKTWTIVNNV